ncbi:MAG: hypothetical protein ACM3S1_09325 [Hyphomicrobiales bacterium]
MARAVTGLLPFPLIGDRVRVDPPDGTGHATIVRLADAAVAGHLVLERDGDALCVRELCIDTAARGFGLGSEAARLVREASARAGWASLRAWAPPDLGLAVYFWSRMGLRPLHGEGPGGGIAFERRLA